MRTLLLGIVLIAAAPALAETIGEIRVEGNARVEREAILGNLRAQVGAPFNPTQIADDIRRLWDLDRFDRVDILRTDEKGILVLIVRVTERPSVREIRHQGLTDVDREEIDETVGVRVGFPVDESAARRSAVKIKKLLADQGFYLGQVGYRIVPAPDHRVDVEFLYTMGDKVLVRDIVLLGNAELPAADILPRLQTQPMNWLSFLTDTGLFDDEKLNIDRQIVEMLYRDRGFLDVKVSAPRVRIDADMRGLRVEIPIDEGTAYTLKKLGFSGELLAPAEKLRKMSELKEGEVFSAGALHRSVERITRFYKDKGYAYANIGTDARPDKKTGTVTMDFTLERGPRVTVERIDVYGNYKTRDKVIRREMKLLEGDYYAASKLDYSKARIEALGFFEPEGGVTLTEQRGSTPDTIVLVVTVKERMTGSINANFGFSSWENFIAMAAVTQDNFLGHGTRMGLQAQYSSLRQIFSFSYYEPRLLDSRWTLSTSLYDNETDYYNFVREATGSSLTGGYLFGDHLHLSLGWMGEQVGISEDKLRFPLPGVIPGQVRFTSALKLRATWDSRDNRLYPSKGWYHSAGLELASPYFGSENDFWRGDMTLRGYARLPLGSVFKSNVKVSYLGANQPMPQEHYFAGGIYTLRGYGLRSIGPTVRVPQAFTPDSPMITQNIGGNKQLIANFEIEVPLIASARVNGVVFYDAGNVWARTDPWLEGLDQGFPFGLMHSVGYGIRWQSPMGPLRFEIGYPLTPRAQDQESQFEFTIGSAF
jgi:outer membrane protein insertion porin family